MHQRLIRRVTREKGVTRPDDANQTNARWVGPKCSGPSLHERTRISSNIHKKDMTRDSCCTLHLHRAVHMRTPAQPHVVTHSFIHGASCVTVQHDTKKTPQPSLCACAATVVSSCRTREGRVLGTCRSFVPPSRRRFVTDVDRTNLLSGVSGMEENSALCSCACLMTYWCSYVVGRYCWCYGTSNGALAIVHLRFLPGHPLSSLLSLLVVWTGMLPEVGPVTLSCTRGAG